MENKTGHVYTNEAIFHDQTGHPEHADRLPAIYQHLVKINLLKELVHIPAHLATQQELQLVHPLEQIKIVCEAFKMAAHLGPDTYTTTASFDVAQKVIGGLINLVSQVINAMCKTDLQSNSFIARI